MDPLTWLSLGLQLAALCSIVGALLLYLLRKVRGSELRPAAAAARTVLVTSVDTALGLQIATYLSGRGWRVIGGCRAGGLGARLAESWLAAQQPVDDAPPPRLATLELDVAREDLLDEAARATAQHLPAGEHGIWAVVNTAGSGGRDGAASWEPVLRGNVLGALRVARTFAPMLAAAAHDHPHAGRLFYIGLTSDTECENMSRADVGCGGDAAAGAAAARWGVWGAARALRASLRARGVRVVLLHTPDLSASDIYAPPVQLAPESRPTSRAESSSSCGSNTCAVTMPGEAAEYSARVLPRSALRVLEDALAAPAPRDHYDLRLKTDSWFTRVPSLRASH